MNREENYGIGIRNYVLKHETAAMRGNVTIDQHLQKLAWIQHERLVHLIVMCLTIIAMFFCLVIAVIAADSFRMVFGILAFVLLCLSGAYLRHYFFLENHVQSWYLLAERLQRQANAARAADEDKEK